MHPLKLQFSDSQQHDIAQARDHQEACRSLLAHHFAAGTGFSPATFLSLLHIDETGR